MAAGRRGGPSRRAETTIVENTVRHRSMSGRIDELVFAPVTAPHVYEGVRLPKNYVMRSVR